MYFIGSYRKQPSENLKYVLDYTTWSGLGPNEEITQVVSSVQRNDGESEAGDLAIGGTYIDPDENNQKVVYFASEGIHGKEYQVTFIATTSTGQVVEREVLYQVEEL